MHDLFQATQKSDLRRVLVCVDFGALKQKTLTVNKYPQPVITGTNIVCIDSPAPFIVFTFFH